MKHFFVLYIFLFPFLSISQKQVRFDSLKALLETSVEDTSRVKLLIEMGKVYRASNFNKAIKYCKEALSYAQRSGTEKWESYALNNLGFVYKYMGEYATAEKLHIQSLKIEEASENDKGIAESLNHIGFLYYRQGNYVKALEYYLRSLKIKEELWDSELCGSRRCASTSSKT